MSITFDLKRISETVKENSASFAVRLGVGDMSGIDEEKWLATNSLKAAAKTIEDYKLNECFDQWFFVGGDIVDDQGKIIGLISPNLHLISKPSEKGNDYHHLLCESKLRSKWKKQTQYSLPNGGNKFSYTQKAKKSMKCSFLFNSYF